MLKRGLLGSPIDTKVERGQSHLWQPGSGFVFSFFSYEINVHTSNSPCLTLRSVYHCTFSSFLYRSFSGTETCPSSSSFEVMVREARLEGDRSGLTCADHIPVKDAQRNLLVGGIRAKLELKGLVPHRVQLHEERLRRYPSNKT